MKETSLRRGKPRLTSGGKAVTSEANSGGETVPDIEAELNLKRGLGHDGAQPG